MEWIKGDIPHPKKYGQENMCLLWVYDAEFEIGYCNPDWVIVGGESGAGCRPFEIEWARDMKSQCEKLEIPFFMKQIGGHPNKRDKMEDLPEDLRIREFPG